MKRTLRGRSDSEESVFSVLLRDRDTPSAACGGSSLGEGAKDERYGFFGLRPQNDGGGSVVLLRVGRDDSARLLAPSLRELSPKVTEGVSQGVETRETFFGIQRKRGF